MKVREIMTSGSLATATLDTTLEEIANMMKAEDVGAIPVLDDDEKLAGIITDRDIVVRGIAEGEDPTECTAEDIILSEQLHTIDPDADVQEALQLMSQHRIRRLPVIEQQEVIGIISLGDLSVKLQSHQAGEALEEISAGVREQPGRDRVEDSRGDREREGRQANGSRDRQPQGQSSSEQAAEQETDSQSGRQGTAIRRGTAQMGSSRRRANKQNASSRGQESSSRGRQDSSARGRKVAPMRAESKTGRSQGKRRAS